MSQPDFKKMMEAAQAIQGRMKQTQEDIERITVEGGSRDHCEVLMSGKHEVRKVTLNEDFIRKESLAFIEEMIANAINQAVGKVADKMREEMTKMAQITKDYGLDLTGKDHDGDDGQGGRLE